MDETMKDMSEKMSEPDDKMMSGEEKMYTKRQMLMAIFGAVVLTILIVLAGYMLMNQGNKGEVTDLTPSPTVTVSTSPTPTDEEEETTPTPTVTTTVNITPTTSDSKTFDGKLGFSFNYKTSQLGNVTSEVANDVTCSPNRNYEAITADKLLSIRVNSCGGWDIGGPGSDTTTEKVMSADGREFDLIIAANNSGEGGEIAATFSVGDVNSAGIDIFVEYSSTDKQLTNRANIVRNLIKSSSFDL